MINEMKCLRCVGIALVAVGLAGCATSTATTIVQEDEHGIEGMQLIGQAEYMTILPANLTYKARIDSGATTCSMSALDIVPFERDGEKWVRFRLPLPSQKGVSTDEIEKSDEMEYPVTRTAEIKRHGAEMHERPAVLLQIRLGTFEGRIEFTLTDRTKYDFPVLVGRNLLEGNAVIDVAQSYIAEKK